MPGNENAGGLQFICINILLWGLWLLLILDDQNSGLLFICINILLWLLESYTIKTEDSVHMHIHTTVAALIIHDQNLYVRYKYRYNK